VFDSPLISSVLKTAAQASYQADALVDLLQEQSAANECDLAAVKTCHYRL
jgi:hypothetical protein